GIGRPVGGSVVRGPEGPGTPRGAPGGIGPAWKEAAGGRGADVGAVAGAGRARQHGPLPAMAGRPARAAVRGLRRAGALGGGGAGAVVGVAGAARARQHGPIPAMAGRPARAAVRVLRRAVALVGGGPGRVLDLGLGVLRGRRADAEPGPGPGGKGRGPLVPRGGPEPPRGG